MEEQETRELLEFLIDYLADEREYSRKRLVGSDSYDGISTKDLFATFRALVNTREPGPAIDRFLAAQDKLLRGLIDDMGVVSYKDGTPSPENPRIRLWEGNIIRIRADAIVNAANSQMLGCWQPGHHCIDNAIHTYAGIQLRAECAQIMNAQGHDEPTGQAKITSGYNLPAEHIIHTVGPVANGRPTAEHRVQLASCYRSCMDLAHSLHLGSLVFCGISTGIFGFPRREAAQIATSTVQQWFEDHPEDDKLTVLFDTYGREDEETYAKLLGIR